MFFLFFFLLAGLALSDCHVLRDYCAEGNTGLAIVVTVMGFLLFLFGGGQELAQFVAFGAAVGTVEFRSRPFFLRPVLRAEFLDMVTQSLGFSLF